MATSMDTSMRRRRIRPLPASSTASIAIGSSRPAAISALDREAENAENRLLQLQLELGDPFSTNTVDLSSRNAVEGLVETMSSVDTASRTHRRFHTAPEAPLQESLVRDTAVANEDSAYLDFMETDVSDYSWPLYDSSTGSWVSAESDLSRQNLETLPPIAQSNRPRAGHLREAVSTSRSVPNLHLPSGQQSAQIRDIGSSATGSSAHRYKRNTASQPQPSHPHLSASSSQSNLPGSSRSIRSTTSALADSETASRTGATTSAWRHTSATPNTIARRAKRRRSISNSSEQPDSTTQVPSRRVSARSHASNEVDSVGASSNNQETSEGRIHSEFVENAGRRVSAAHPDVDHAASLRFPSFSLDLPSLPNPTNGSEASNLSRYIDNLMAAEQMSQSVATTSLRDLLDPPPPVIERQQPRPPLARQTSSSFAVRRGNDAGLSLGSLPQFHFNPVFDEGLVSPLTTVNQGSATAVSPNAVSSGSSSRRRPHLQRNTTAVSPPEESPLNSPEVDMRVSRSQASTATAIQHGRSADQSFFMTRRRASPPPVRANWRRDSDRAPSENLLEDLERTRSILEAVVSYRHEDQSVAEDRPDESPDVTPNVVVAASMSERLDWPVEEALPAPPSNHNLWGEVADPLPIPHASVAHRSSTAAPSRIPTLRRRPGALLGGLRGPTRSSNEAWMRSQGIDFYESSRVVGPTPSTAADSSQRRTISASTSTSTSVARPLPTLRRMPHRTFHIPAVPPAPRAPIGMAASDSPLEDRHARLARRESAIWQHLQDIRRSMDGDDTRRPRSPPLSSLPPPQSSQPSVAHISRELDSLSDVSGRLRDIRGRLDSLASTSRRARAQIDDVSSSNTLRLPRIQPLSRSPVSLASESSRLLRVNETVRAPPAITLPRTNFQRDAALRTRSADEATNAPQTSRENALRPVLQPFEEIYAEVEAEFASRDRSLPTGGRPISRHRTRTSGLMQDLFSGLDDPISRRRPSLGLDLDSDLSLDIPDRFGFWDHRESLLGREALLFDPHLDLAAGSDDERVPLPPFLLRSLRARRQATFGERGTGIAAEADNYLDDFELDLSYEGLLALSERIGEARGKGATDAALEAGLTRYQYASSAMEGVSTASADSEARCGICLEDYEAGDECATSKQCGHGMHFACLETWLKRNHTCPICRQAAV